jgi:hypothetical protein
MTGEPVLPEMRLFQGGTTKNFTPQPIKKPIAGKISIVNICSPATSTHVSKPPATNKLKQSKGVIRRGLPHITRSNARINQPPLTIPPPTEALKNNCQEE